jgi:hypothetical protein
LVKGQKKKKGFPMICQQLVPEGSENQFPHAWYVNGKWDLLTDTWYQYYHTKVLVENAVLFQGPIRETGSKVIQQQCWQ